VLLAFLGELWQVPVADERQLLLAGLDRGFVSLRDATDAARLFLLRHHLIRRPVAAAW
jgi:hypothetical protein